MEQAHMLKGIDLVTLSKQIIANQALKKDYISPASSLGLTVDDQGDTLMQIPEHGNFPMQPLVHRQLSTFAGIPAAYYDRMKTEAPDLLADNINTWMARMAPERKRMVRTLGGEARALLSNSYQRVEHEEIAEIALPVLHELPGVEIVSAQVTQARLYIHFTVPSVRGEVKVGDIVQAGGIISNSETGQGSVSVVGLLWRLVCLNGAKSGDAFRRAHIGRKVEDSEELWADDTKKADDRAILLKVRDMTKAVVDETRFRAQIDKLRELADPAAKISGNLVSAVELLTQKVGLPDSMRPSILQSLAEGSDLTAWGLVNAVTAQAHKSTDYDAAVELEGAGGTLINLPPAEWRTILQAA
jgi:hypothetical protein